VPRGTEVVVAGAGPAGCVTALLLARLGARVALVTDPDGATARPIVGEVLPAAARPAFARLGLGEVLDDPVHRPSAGVISAWGPGEPAVLGGTPALGPGLRLDRRVLDAALLVVAHGAGATVVAMPRAAWPALAVLPGQAGGPQVVVDASGRAASVARAAGWTLERADRLVAIAGVLDPIDAVHPDDPWLRVAADPDGWWSSMVLPSGRRVAAFHTDARLSAATTAAAPARWWTDLAGVPALDPIAAPGSWRPPAAVHIVAADSRRLRPPRPIPPASGPPTRVVPAGDAEMAFDPLSSFGILGAVSSSEEAVPVIAAHMDGDATARIASARREIARTHRWERYRARLAAAYAEETRWPDSPFWADR
jgi:flavin-dependent dehydrogenase